MTDAIPLPFLRERFREARGYLLSGDTTPPSLRDTAMRFMRGLSPDVRRLCANDAREPQPGELEGGNCA